MLKACCQHRWGPALPEEQRGRSVGIRTTRMPAQVEFHGQTQVTCDHFGHFQDRQQESQEEAQRVARDAHHQALAMVAMLEGHIECLSCSVSCGWHGSQGQLGSCTGSQEVEDVLGVEGVGGAAGGYPLASGPL